MALIGIPVTMGSQIVEAKWNSIDEPPGNSSTCLFVSGTPNGGANSVGLYGLGYFNSRNEVQISYGHSHDGMPYTHWCYLPGQELNNQELEDSGEEETGDDNE